MRSHAPHFYPKISNINNKNINIYAATSPPPSNCNQNRVLLCMKPAGEKVKSVQLWLSLMDSTQITW